MRPTGIARRTRLRNPAAAAALSLAFLATAAPVVTAAATAPAAEAAQPAAGVLDPAALTEELDAVHAAGMYGAYASVRDGAAEWNGATGVADLATGRPTRPDMEHRVGSVTKSFTAVAVLQQSAAGRIRLDAPVGDYLPALVPGERGRLITVRMLMNHTSGIADYVPQAFPSLALGSTASLDEYRHRTVRPAMLIAWGLGAPQLFPPGTDWSYSNTNYVLLGELLRTVTGRDPEEVIAQDVIRRAGLRHTYFPGTDPLIRGPHAKLYENLHGLVDPRRDASEYSEYNMTMAGTAGALISTPQDLNTFYRTLLRGGLLPAAQLREMRTTTPVKDENGRVIAGYGLGIYTLDTPCGPAWGHDGSVWGGGTTALSSADGTRQFALGFNLTKYQRTDAEGRPVPHPVDAALDRLQAGALCGTGVLAPGTPSALPRAHPPLLPLVPPSLSSATAQRLR
ncbi:beta-lactamase family protein [Streptomyces sp. NBC_00536]|uniref:serine hydrolase domain-containing protein n=1 Tax=Streptomyces sp. NBC_00536 TaxID=2975769 RepID=UPI002E81C471|nr:serine hydrolase domain-containing protein [Streptomyces sp. NBC_00536]WUC77335.1 beta-lactamase family protein [Streptomyces sp. NBC_00536]